MTMILLGYSFESNATVCVIEQTAYKAELKHVHSSEIKMNFNHISEVEILKTDFTEFHRLNDEISCQKLKVAQDGLDVLSIATNAGSLYAACTGLGTPVAVYLGLAGLTLQTVKFAVSQLPCDPDSDISLIDQLVKENVCIELEKNGLVCEKSN